MASSAVLDNRRCPAGVQIQVRAGRVLKVGIVLVVLSLVLTACAALVLFMTLPGLALFYGGLVRAKNVLSVLAQCLGIAGLVTILWWAVGYSLVFSRGCPFIGGLKFAFLHGVDARPNADYSYWVSQNVFAMYQLMLKNGSPSSLSLTS